MSETPRGGWGVLLALQGASGPPPFPPAPSRSPRQRALTLKSVLLTCSKTRAGVRDCRVGAAGWRGENREKRGKTGKRGLGCPQQGQAGGVPKPAAASPSPPSGGRRGWLQSCPLPLLTTGSFTMSSRLMILGPPRRFSRILISRLIFFFFTGWQAQSRLRSEPSPAPHAAASGRVPRRCGSAPPPRTAAPHHLRNLVPCLLGGPRGILSLGKAA